MQNITVIGTQWGDEGKGKIVDLLSKECDVIVRFQGGHNAGHTLQIDGVTYKLSLLPSGIVRQGKTSVIGNGVVIDLAALQKEMQQVQSQGVSITPDNLIIADNACIILDLHRELDQNLEAAKGKNKIGTTGRGIGPAYEDKAARRAIRIGDLADANYLAERVDNLLVYHNILRKGLGLPQLNAADILAQLQEFAQFINPYVKPVWYELNRLAQQGKKIMFEGAQGTLLDVDHGTYPFVTSSNTISSQSATGSGLNTKNYVIGLAKAYCTRVGSGPFPTEQLNDLGQHLGERGHEFGTVTGRKRRCGWLDLVLLKKSCALNAVDGIALTKLDVLDELETIKLCVGYKLDGKQIDYLPSIVSQQERLKPIYKEFTGWQTSTYGVRDIAKLPTQAQDYISYIQEFTGTNVDLVSTSPEREDCIFIKQLF